jgi:hypothetical protein
VIAKETPEEASHNKLMVEDGLRGVAEWEAEYGPLSEDALAAADAVLDVASIGRGSKRRGE